MEPFKPELIREVLESSDEYSEDLRNRFASSPVFDRANAIQREFIETRLTREHFITAWNAAHEVINILDSEAAQQGVMYESVSMKGEGILVPKFELDFAANVAMMSLLDKETQQSRSFASYLHPDEYRGKFAGFTVRFAETSEVGVYIPLLAYQVSMSVSYTPNAHVALFATGDVGTTTLQFDKDEQFEGALVPLRTLFELCSDKADSINRINMTLASTDEYDASSMRRIAYHAEKLINSIDTQRQPAIEDALGDLISHYIGRSSSYLLETNKLSLSALTAESGIEYFESEVYPLHNVCLDVVFLNQHVLKDGEITYRDRRTIHLVLPSGARTTFVPIVELQQFTKQ